MPLTDDIQSLIHLAAELQPTQALRAESIFRVVAELRRLLYEAAIHQERPQMSLGPNDFLDDGPPVMAGTR